MKDVTGKPLEVGQFVVASFDPCTTLMICEVSHFTKQKVAVIPRKTFFPRQPSKMLPPNRDFRLKFPEQVAIVEIKDVETLLG